MFYSQCNDCNERWELGTASTCKCPEETTIDWKDYSIPVDKMKTLSIGNIKPNYNMTFHRDGKQIGVLDFNGPEMTFTGDMDESAKVFFDWIAESFKSRLEQDRADEREACAKVCEELLDRPSGYQGTWEGYGKFKTQMTGLECAAAIRARSNT